MVGKTDLELIFIETLPRELVKSMVNEVRSTWARETPFYGYITKEGTISVHKEIVRLYRDIVSNIAKLLRTYNSIPTRYGMNVENTNSDKNSSEMARAFVNIVRSGLYGQDKEFIDKFVDNDELNSLDNSKKSTFLVML